MHGHDNRGNCGNYLHFKGWLFFFTAMFGALVAVATLCFALDYANHNGVPVMTYTYFLVFWAGGAVGYGLCLFIWHRSTLRRERGGK